MAIALFPISALLVSLLAFLMPELLQPLASFIVPLLGLIMFGMGISLRAENFLKVFQRPKSIAIGVTLQFVLMPCIAYFVSVSLGLEEALLIGMVLVGSCPGGTASNVICYLARGDVALSITLTITSTLLAVIFTPLLTWLYIGERVPVPVFEMMLNIIKIILLPVALGVGLNHFFSDKLHPVKHIFPLISMFAIVLIIGAIVALNHNNIPMLALPMMTAIFWHNLLGLGSGYMLARACRLDEQTSRTIAIEVGMQNSGLAVALAQGYFSSLAALPGAIFSIWHNITGSIVAGYWGRKVLNQPPESFDAE